LIHSFSFLKTRIFNLLSYIDRLWENIKGDLGEMEKMKCELGRLKGRGEEERGTRRLKARGGGRKTRSR